MKNKIIIITFIAVILFGIYISFKSYFYYKYTQTNEYIEYNSADEYYDNIINLTYTNNKEKNLYNLSNLIYSTIKSGYNDEVAKKGRETIKVCQSPDKLATKETKEIDCTEIFNPIIAYILENTNNDDNLSIFVKDGNINHVSINGKNNAYYTTLYTSKESVQTSEEILNLMINRETVINQNSGEKLIYVKNELDENSIDDYDIIIKDNPRTEIGSQNEERPCCLPGYSRIYAINDIGNEESTYDVEYIESESLVRTDHVIRALYFLYEDTSNNYPSYLPYRNDQEARDYIADTLRDGWKKAYYEGNTDVPLLIYEEIETDIFPYLNENYYNEKKEEYNVENIIRSYTKYSEIYDALTIYMYPPLYFEYN